MIGEEGYPGRSRAHPGILNGVLRGLLLLVCALALTAPVAAAQDDEIFVDPGSPSGKEYALPVESARRQAAKDAREHASSARPAPLFGEGVEAGSTAGQAGSASGGGAAIGGGGAAGDADGGTPGAPGTGAGPSTLKAQAAAADGGMGPAAVIGVGAGVLLLGGALGVLLRRRAARDG
jgi:hypothetical protein